MSDPSAWTPPCSPEFLGEDSCRLVEQDADIFSAAEFSAGHAFSDGVFGLPCGSHFMSILCQFDDIANFECWSECCPTAGLIWSRTLLHTSDNQFVKSNTHCREFIASHLTEEAIRNDLAVLSSTVLCLSKTRTANSDAVSSVAQLRAILVNLGVLCLPSSSLHIKLELWILFLKLLEHFHSYEKLPLINLSFGLDCKSALDAYGYFVEIVLENLICSHSVPLRDSHSCGCFDSLWVLIVRYSEKFQSGWFKYLHGKMMKIALHKQKLLYEPASLERLRPSPELYREAGIRNDDGGPGRYIWLVYWSLLAHTAPIHRAYMSHVTSAEVSAESLQKYPIVVWLIRKQFLGESVPSEPDMQLSLKCLLRVVDIWGPSVETLRPLWLFFGRELDRGSIPTTYSGTELQELRFSNWLSLIQRHPTTDSNSYDLFCLLFRTLRDTQLEELKSILNVSLPSLTRRAVFHYFLLLGHIFDAHLARCADENAETSRLPTILVDVVLHLCPQNVFETDLHNWDAGRRCSTLQGLQNLILLYRHHWLQAKSASVLFEAGFRRLIQLSGVIRSNLFEMLSTDSFPSEATSSARPQRLSSMGWKLDLLNSTVQFGLDMVEWSNKTPSELLLRIVCICFDPLFFQSARWPIHDSWNVLIRRLLELLSSAPPCSESTVRLQAILWSSVYPSLKECTSVHCGTFKSAPRHVCRALAGTLLKFIQLSCSEHLEKLPGISVPSPLSIIEHFSMNCSISPSFRFAFIEELFSYPGLSDKMLSAISKDQSTVADVSLLFVTLWLTYCLLVRPTMDDHGSNRLNSLDMPYICITPWTAYFPSEFSTLLTTTDPEMVLMNLASKFDQFQSFQERMEYKALICGSLKPLCTFLCDLCSVSTLAKEHELGLYHCLIPGLQQDALCTIGYRAVSFLVRHCSRLLYSPFTSGTTASSLESFVTHFLLPRQLYEWEKLQRSGLDQMPLPTFVIECMRDRLPDFTIGLAQLPWRSDSYIGRVLKDTVKLYHTYLGSECIATSILNSPVAEFRARLLYLAMAESVKELADSQRNIQQIKISVKKWLELCKSIHRGTHSLESRQRDAPYIVAPILLASNMKDLFADELKKDCDTIIDEYKRAVKAISSIEMRSQLEEDCQTITQNHKVIPDLCKYFEK